MSYYRRRLFIITIIRTFSWRLGFEYNLNIYSPKLWLKTKSFSQPSEIDLLRADPSLCTVFLYICDDNQMAQHSIHKRFTARDSFSIPKVCILLQPSTTQRQTDIRPEMMLSGKYTLALVSCLRIICTTQRHCTHVHIHCPPRTTFR